MTRDELLFWFGWHYDVLDQGFRSKKWADPLAVQAFIPIQKVGRDPIPMTTPIARCVYDTTTMTYLYVECNGVRVDLSEWKL